MLQPYRCALHISVLCFGLLHEWLLTFVPNYNGLLRIRGKQKKHVNFSKGSNQVDLQIETRHNLWNNDKFIYLLIEQEKVNWCKFASTFMKQYAQEPWEGLEVALASETGHFIKYKADIKLNSLATLIQQNFFCQGLTS